MAQEINRNANATADENVRVVAPAAGEQVVVAAQASGQLNLDFDPSQLAEITQSGNDLVFHFENGATATVSDFFTFAEEGEMSFALPDGTTTMAADLLAAFDIDLPAPAAGPGAGAGAAGGGSGDYRSDPGAFTDGVDRLGMTDPFFWGVQQEDPEDPQLMLASITMGTGDMGTGLFFNVNDFNESGTGLALNIGLSIPARGEVTISIRIGGNASVLENGTPEFMADISLPGGSFPGGSYTYDPATGIITITLPTGSTGVTIPIETFDDHLSEALENLTFEIIETGGPVVGGVGQTAEVNFIEDGAIADPADPLYGLKDGPVIGLFQVSDVDEVYEGSGAVHTFQITLGDPHSTASVADDLDGFEDYLGYVNKQGQPDGRLSESVTVTITTGGGSAVYGEDYGLRPSEDLLQLRSEGKVSFDLDEHGFFVPDPDTGLINITLNGQLDANGNPVAAGNQLVLPEDLGSLTFEARPFPNSDLNDRIDGVDGGKEDIVLGIGTDGKNESTIGQGSASGEIADDPKLSISSTPTVHESIVGEGTQYMDVTLAFDKYVDNGVDVRVVLELGGTAGLWKGVAGTEYAADFFLPGTPVAGNPPAGVYYQTELQITIGGTTHTVKFSYNTDGTITVEGPAEVFDGGLTVQFPINDDHITESLNVNEVINLTVKDVDFAENVSDGRGTALDKGGNVSIDTGFGNDKSKTEIIEDRSETEDLDGPVVGITVTDGTSVPGSAASVDEVGGSQFIFNITFKDPSGSTDYQGYPNAGGVTGNLSQDMVLKITVGSESGAATYGSDYEFDFTNLDNLVDAGMISNYTFENGVITIYLNGLVDANGNVHTESGHVPFNMSQIGNLSVTAKVINDGETELDPETITLTVETVGGLNESTGTGTATGTINEDDPANFNGPVFSLVTDASVLESNRPADDKHDTADNTTTIKVAIESGNGANSNILANEDIPIIVKVTGSANCNFNAGAPGETAVNGDMVGSHDAYWAPLDQWTVTIGNPGVTYTFDSMTTGANGIDMVFKNGSDTFTVSDVKFNADGTINMTIDGGSNLDHGNVSINIPVGITDDMRESETGESLNVSLELVAKGQVNGEDVAYGESTIKNPDAGNSLKDTNTPIEIVDDKRTDGSDSNNPPYHDGPFVTLDIKGDAADKNVIHESSLDKDGNAQNTDVTFVVSLRNPNGDKTIFTDAEETVTVTLTLKGVDTTFNTSYGDATDVSSYKYGDVILDVRTENGVDYLYDANGIKVGEFIINKDVNGDPDGTVSIKVEVDPSDNGVVEFTLRANDDPLGASDSGNHDRASEKFEVEITEVNGNEARVDATEGNIKQEVTVKDDLPDNPATENDPNLEGMRFGIEWQTSGTGRDLVSEYDNGKAVLGEGQRYNIHITTLNSDGSAVWGTHNPYGNYTGNAFPDDQYINLNFSSAASLSGTGQDLVITMDPRLFDEIKAGHVELTLADGTVIDQAYLTTGAGKDLGFSDIHLPAGDMTLKIYAGQPTDGFKDSLRFDVYTAGDNVNEYEHEGLYQNNGNPADEGFSFGITSVSGNESAISGNGKLEAIITDRADGMLLIDGGEFNSANTEWGFKITVDYPDGEKGTTPGSANQWQEVKYPGENVYVHLKITDGKIMQHGQEYKADALSLFMSLNGLTEAQVDTLCGGHTLADYYTWMSSLGDLKAYNDHILVKDTGVNLNDPASYTESWAVSTGDTTQSNTYEVYIPKDEWASNNGELDFTIDQGDHLGGPLPNPGDGFQVELVKPGDADMKGEIVKVDDEGAAAQPTNDFITVSIEGDPTIYEDKNMNGGAKDNTDYHVSFHPNGVASTGSFSASGDISLVLTVFTKPDVNFDFNLKDNAYTDNWDNGEGVGDFCIGGIGTYGSVSELISMLNAWLADPSGGNQEGITITGITARDGAIDFKFTVAEGYDLSKGLTINFKALDDSISDNVNELFTVRVGGFETTNNVNVSTSQTPGHSREDSTEILDESGDYAKYNDQLNGFAISVEDSSGFEASEHTGEKMVHVTTRAYALGDGDGQPITMTELQGYWAEYKAANPTTTLDFNSFAVKFFGPSQNITVTYELKNGTAVAGEDYVNETEHTFEPGDWTGPFVDGNGNVYFVATGDKGLPIETIRDPNSEGDENLSIKITDSKGNESRPYEDGDNIKADATQKGENVTAGADVTIHDFYDGPTVIKFGPGGEKVVEPVDTVHGPENTLIPLHKSEITIKIDGNAAMKGDVALWLSNPGAGAIYGEGVYIYKGGQFYTVDPLTGGPGTLVDIADKYQNDKYPGFPGGQDGDYLYIVEQQSNNPNGIEVKVPLLSVGELAEGAVTITVDKVDGSHTNDKTVTDIGKSTPTGETVSVPGDSEHKADPNSVTYVVELDTAALEDVVVWIKSDLANNASDADYYLGKGMYEITADGKIIAYGSDATDPKVQTLTVLFDASGYDLTTEAGVKALAGALAPVLKGLYGHDVPQYIVDAFINQIQSGNGTNFVIIPENGTAAEFEVKILDDNDTLNNDRTPNSDVKGRENIGLEITGIEGSEVVYKDGNGNLIPFDKEADFQLTVDTGSGKLVGIANQADQTFTWKDARGEEVTADFNKDTVSWIDEAGNLNVIDFNVGKHYTYNGDKAVGTPSKTVDVDSSHEFAWVKGAEVPTFDGNNNSNYKTETEIADDMEGPMLSFNAPNGVIGWNGDAIANAEDVSVTLKVQDYCSEDVYVIIEVLGSNGEVVGYLRGTIGAGELSATQKLGDMVRVNADGTAYKGSDAFKWPEGDFHIKVHGGNGGETVADGNYIKVDHSTSGGSGTHIVVGGFDAKNAIHENVTPSAINPDHFPQYGFTLSNVSSATVKDVEFNVVFRPGTAGTDDMHGKSFGSDRLTVKIDDADLTKLINAGHDIGKGEFIIIATGNDGSARVVFVPKGGNISNAVSLDNSSVGGKLPSATLDDKIEGNEDFSAIITGPKNVETGPETVAKTDVIDKTEVTLKYTYFVDGKEVTDISSLPEGTVVTVKVTMVDQLGRPVTADKTLNFDVNYNGDLNGDGKIDANEATWNEDFGGDKHFYIEAGQPSGSFQIKIYEDHLNEGVNKDGNEGFKFDVSLGDHPSTHDDIYAQIKGGVNESKTVTIKDNASGPVINFTVDKTSVYENDANGVTVEYGSYIRSGENGSTGIREVVQEDATLTFVISDKGGKTLLKDDLAGFKYGDQEFTIGGDGSVTPSNPAFKVTYDATSDTYTIVVVIKGGEAMGKFQIIPAKDNLDESGEGFTVTLKNTEGSETTPVNGKVEQSVEIKDEPSGYKVTLDAVSGTEGEHAGIKISFNGSTNNAPGEDVKVTLTVGDGQGMLGSESGDVIIITLPNGKSFTYDVNTGVATAKDPSDLADYSGVVSSYDKSTGQMELTLPKEALAAPGDLTVLYPIDDNSTVDPNRPLEITVGVSGGEVGFGAKPSFDSKFVVEQGAVGSAKAYTEFTLEHDANSGDIGSVVGTSSVAVNTGLSEEADVNTVIHSIVINGTTYNSGSGAWSVANGVITINGLPIGEHYDVRIVYNSPSDAADKALVQQVKSDVSVSGKVDGGDRGVTSTVKDETGTDVDNPKDGPEASIDITTVSVDEGGAINGKFVVDMHAKAGDLNSDGSVTVQDTLTVVLNVSQNLDGSYNQLTCDNLDTLKAYATENAGITWTQVNGKITIVIPQGAKLPSGDEFEFSFSTTSKDNSVVGGPEFKVSVESITGKNNVYENVSIKSDAASDSITPTDNATNTGPVISITGSGNVTEGNNALFTLKLDLPADGNSKTLQESIEVTIKVSGALAGSQVRLGNGSWATVDEHGNVTVTIPKGTSLTNGSYSGNLSVKTVDDAYVNVNQKVTVSIESVTGKNDGTYKYEQVTKSGTASSAEQTVIDDTSSADGINLGISGKQSTDSPNMLEFSVSLAAAGAFSGNTIGQEVSFKLDLSDFNNNQILSIAESLEKNGLTAVPDADGLTVSLPSNYDITKTIDFSVEVQQGYGNDQNYSVSIIDANGGTLEHFGVAADGVGKVDITADLVVHNSASGGVVIGGDGNDVFIANTGDDVFKGGNGEDLFVWKEGSLGGADQILDFNLDFENPGDHIAIEGLFGISESHGVSAEECEEQLDALLGTGNWDAEGKVLTIADASTTLEALFDDADDKLILSIKSGDETVQVINVDFAGSGFELRDDNGETARQILQEMIKYSND